MKKRPLAASSLIACLLFALPIGAQNTGSAATGDGGNTTEKTFQNSGASQVKHDNTAFDRSQQLGTGTGDGKDTKSTKTKDYLENSGGLDQTTTSLFAPNSVSPKPIGRQAETLGFKKGVDEEYVGPYKGAAESGGTLPYTSTAAVDIDIIGGAASTSGAQIDPQKWKSNKLQWGVYQVDDAAPQYGMEDPYGFFGD